MSIMTGLGGVLAGLGLLLGPLEGYYGAAGGVIMRPLGDEKIATTSQWSSSGVRRGSRS